MTDNNDIKNSYQRRETRLEKHDTLFIEIESNYEADDLSRFLICSSVDVSVSGIKAHIDEPLPLHAIYQLCIENSVTQSRMLLAAQVKWLVVGDGGYFIGLEILSSDDTDVAQWMRYIADLLQA